MTTDIKSMTNDKGALVQAVTSFRNWITADGSSGFKAESGRYHLYVAYACPFAARVLVVRVLKGLESAIGITVVDWYNDRAIGWSFTDKKAGCQPDTVNGKKTLKEIYQLADPNYSGRVSVPVLWDKVKKTIVNNESGEIIQMLNSEFNAFCATEKQKSLDLYPKTMKSKIDEVIQWMNDDVSTGVYKAGLATKQEPYDEAVTKLFSAMDKLESMLGHSRFLVGNDLTLADIRLFTTLVRFDWVYHGHFKCNKKKLIEYPNLWGFTRDIYNLDGVKDTVVRDHIMKTYHLTMPHINPNNIVPVGPDLNFSIPEERRKKFGAV